VNGDKETRWAGQDLDRIDPALCSKPQMVEYSLIGVGVEVPPFGFIFEPDPLAVSISANAVSSVDLTRHANALP
jgi:hypothetical protein